VIQIITKPATELSNHEIDQIINLTEATWPHTKIENSNKAVLRQNFINRNPKKTSILGLIEDRIIAYAEVFPRRITVNGEYQLIMGLAAVCVDHNLRGKGHGKDIIITAFQFVNGNEYQVSLFQTAVPHFYTKLNCKEINHKIENSLNESTPGKNPFWDDHIMVYPSEFELNEGIIDLKGEGY
jgi:predicted N-acetyltransferase YhbS